jgi:hypothetical protein
MRKHRNQEHHHLYHTAEMIKSEIIMKKTMMVMKYSSFSNKQSRQIKIISIQHQMPRILNKIYIVILKKIKESQKHTVKVPKITTGLAAILKLISITKHIAPFVSLN